MKVLALDIDRCSRWTTRRCYLLDDWQSPFCDYDRNRNAAKAISLCNQLRWTRHNFLRKDHLESLPSIQTIVCYGGTAPSACRYFASVLNDEYFGRLKLISFQPETFQLDH